MEVIFVQKNTKKLKLRRTVLVSSKTLFYLNILDVSNLIYFAMEVILEQKKLKNYTFFRTINLCLKALKYFLE
jgi:hypothetical protein